MAEGIKTKCDFCTNEAIVDGKTAMGPWAFMCQRHFDRFGIKADGFYKMLKPTAIVKKKCSRCGVEKPITDFYSYFDVYGCQRYRTECKACNLKRRRK